MKTAIWAALLASVFCLLTTCAPAAKITNIYPAASVDDDDAAADDDASPDPADDDTAAPPVPTCENVWSYWYNTCKQKFFSNNGPIPLDTVIADCEAGNWPHFALGGCEALCIADRAAAESCGDVETCVINCPGW